MTYRRHRLEIGPLVLGLVYLGIVATWGLFELGAIGTADAAWVVPVVLIGAGGLGVVLATTRPRRAATAPAGFGPWAAVETGHTEATDDAGPSDDAGPTDTIEETPGKEHRDD